MTTIDTSTSATATAYSNQRKVDRCQNGVLWAVFQNGTTGTFEFHYSSNDGTSFTHDASGDINTGGTTYTANGSLFIDLDDYAHFIYKDGSDGYLYYVRGTPNAGRTSYTWSSASQVGSSTVQFDYPDLVAHREGSAWRAHIVWSYDYWSGSAQDLSTYYAMVSITAAGVISVGSQSVIGGDYGTLTDLPPTYPSIDFHHTGDAKTVSGSTPHLYAAWSSGVAGTGIRFKKATYSGGSWSWGAERGIDTSRYVTSTPFDWVACLFDGTRVIVGGLWYDGSTRSTELRERDAADTTTTTRVTGGSQVRVGSMTYDGDGDVHFIGNVTTDFRHLEWDRSANTTTLTTLATIADKNVYASTKRGYAKDLVEVVYTEGSASPWNVTYHSISLNTAPDAPTWNTADNQARDVAGTLTLDWNFEDSDTADSQSEYNLRRTVGAGSVEHWNAGTSTWSATAVWNVTSTTEATLPIAWGADGDGNHAYSVRTKDAAGLTSSFSSSLTVIPSAKDNPTISTPADAGTVTSPSVTMTWTAATQTAYRAQLLDASSNVIEDSGWVTSTDTSYTFATNLANSTSYKVKVTTKNDEGLSSTADTNSFSVSYTPPATPTLVVASDGTTGLITVTITNPGTGATEASNDVFVRVASGGRADIDRPVGGDGIRIATGVAVDGTFTDYAVASGVSYEYLVRAVADTTATADSAWT